MSSKNEQRNRKIVKGIAIYSIGTFGTRILSFLIVPLYTYYITTQEMGVYDVLHSSVNLLTPLVTLQISDAAYRWMIRNERVEDSIRSTIQVLFLNSLIVSIIIFVVDRFYEIPYVGYFVGLLITSRILQTSQKLLRGLENQGLYAVSSILFTFVYLVLNVFQVCVLKLGVVSLLQSAIIANVLVVIVIFSTEKRLRVSIFKSFDLLHIKNMFSYSAPLIPNHLNWWVMGASDRYIIALIMGASYNGIYSIACKFPSILQLVLNLFNTSWQDMAIAEEEKDGKYYSKVFERLYVFSFTMLPALIALTQLYIRITMETSYHDATKYVAFLYLGTVFQFFSSFYGVGYLKDKNTKQASKTSIYGAMVNVIVNLLLIKIIGLYAATISTFLGFLVMWFIRERQNREALQIIINKKKFVSSFLVAFIISCVSHKLSNKGDIVLLLAGIMYFAYMNRDLIKKIGNIIKTKLMEKKGSKYGK